MAEYFHIPPECGWEENTHYVCEVSTGYGNPILSAIMYSGFLNTALELGVYSGVFSPLIDQTFRPLKNGVKSICKSCYNSKSRERRKQNPDPNSLIRKYSIYE